MVRPFFMRRGRGVRGSPDVGHAARVPEPFGAANVHPGDAMEHRHDEPDIHTKSDTGDTPVVQFWPTAIPTVAWDIAPGAGPTIP